MNRVAYATLRASPPRASLAGYGTWLGRLGHEHALQTSKAELHRPARARPRPPRGTASRLAGGRRVLNVHESCQMNFAKMYTVAKCRTKSKRDECGRETNVNKLRKKSEIRFKNLNYKIASEKRVERD